MTLDFIAALIESTYYNGRVLANDKRMDRDDFLQYARAANGEIMRTTWYEERQAGDPNLYFAGSISTERYEIEKRGRFRTVVLPEGGAVKLPYAMGIMRVAPAMTDTTAKEPCDEDYDYSDVYAKGVPGMEYSFGGYDSMDDLGEGFYVTIGNSIRLFGFEKAKFAEVDLIKNDEDIDIPEGVAFRIINSVLGSVLKVAGWPVDTTSNNDPNVVTLKQQLANPQSV